MFNIENPMLYSMYDAIKTIHAPMADISKSLEARLTSQKHLISKTHFGRVFGAYYNIVNRTTKHYAKPEFGIEYCKTKHGIFEVEEQRPLTSPFCNLLHFKKHSNNSEITKQKPMLIAAPLAGHYPTLLRGTVEDLLPHYDVYITEWSNARDVPLFDGSYDLDDVITTFIEYFEFFKGHANVIAVCQPTVPVLAAISHMEANNNPYTPKTFTLMGGPIDTRVSPTKVNNFATDKSLHWFSNQLITRVPFNYAGAFRRVYPGFLQLFGFMSMNMRRHVGAHINLFKDLVKNDGESANKRKKFYDEYLAVMDIPAEFYLQTIDTVFQKYSLPKGKMKYKGSLVEPAAIKNAGLLVVEGELDDIAGVGQTKAAIDLCKNIKSKKYHLQKGAGHYGIFNGEKFRKNIVPVIKEFVDKHNAKIKTKYKK